MTEVCSYQAGSSPLLISIPHDGRLLAPGMAERMTADGLALPDTDWHVIQLYDFAHELDAHVLAANYSRYVVDLNRPSDDTALYAGKLSTGLCPTRTFFGRDIYLPDQVPDAEEVGGRITTYWQPYHQQLAEALEAIRDEFGCALLWDGHSIPGEVPALFDGSLPDLNLGTNDGSSCASHIAQAVASCARASDYSSVQNGRFRGGYITRHYGNPERGVHAIQLELAQRCYMDEEELIFNPAGAESLAGTIRKMLEAFLESGARG